LTLGAIEWFANQGYDPKMGARPLERIIKQEIQEKLANEILFGKLSQGGKVKVSTKGKSIKLTIL
jgi:ATP-dependent Clp protease ATP-binding subunit ClpA